MSVRFVLAPQAALDLVKIWRYIKDKTSLTVGLSLRLGVFVMRTVSINVESAPLAQDLRCGNR
jgi:hypothetical protein